MNSPHTGQTRDTSEQATRRPRLLLADDHEEVREELRRLLEPEFEVLRVVGDGEALIAATVELEADVVVSDLQMPKMGGVEAGRRILAQNLCQAVVIISMYLEAHLVQAALDAGVRAYVLKMDASEELIPAIHAALRGERYLSMGLRHLIPEVPPDCRPA